MRIILDFDYTLFDTEAFRVGMIHALATHGVTDEIYRTTERELLQEDDRGFYTFALHVHKLAEVTGVDLHDIHETSRSVFDTLHSFVFPDAQTLLETLEEEKMILTFGDDSWQRAKIEGSGVDQYVQEVHTTDGHTKDEAIAPLIIPETQIVFVDDRGSAIDAVKQAFPQVRCIRLRRPGTPYYDEPCTAADVEATELSLNLLTA